VIAQAIIGHRVSGFHNSGRAVSFRSQARATDWVTVHSGVKEAPFEQPNLQATIYGKVSDKCRETEHRGIATRITSHLSQLTTAAWPLPAATICDLRPFLTLRQPAHAIYDLCERGFAGRPVGVRWLALPRGRAARREQKDRLAGGPSNPDAHRQSD
jgi:hypothetical protein